MVVLAISTVTKTQMTLKLVEMIYLESRLSRHALPLRLSITNHFSISKMYGVVIIIGNTHLIFCKTSESNNLCKQNYVKVPLKGH